MTDETERLVQAWILRFCEAPILVDAELMRAVLADGKDEPEDAR